MFLQDGNGVVRGNYLSVFLELSAGLPETSKYVIFCCTLTALSINSSSALFSFCDNFLFIFFTVKPGAKLTCVKDLFSSPI